MRIRDRLRRTLDGLSAGLAVSYTYRPVDVVPDIPAWMHGNLFGLTAEEMQFGDAFEQIPIVHAIVRLIQHDCANLVRNFYKGQREVKRQFGNMVDVFMGGNDRDTGREFLLNLFGDLCLYGNAFVYLERGRAMLPGTPPYAIWTLHPPSVRVVPGPNRTVQEYVWFGGGEPRSMKPWQIIHVKNYTAQDRLVGTSWVEPAKADWMAQYHAMHILQQFYARGGLSPGTWSPDYGSGSGPQLKETDIRKMQEQYSSRFQSLERLWRPVVMQGFKKVESGQSIGDLRLDDMMMLINANLCRAAGVPPWMLGIKEHGSLDQGRSSETSSENYWRSTVGNYCGLVDDVFTERFCPLFPGGDGVIVETDFDDVPALQQARLEMMKGAVLASGSPVISVNEARDWWGDDPSPLPEHDVVGGPAAAAAAAAAAARAIQQQPSESGGGEQPVPSAAGTASRHGGPDASVRAASRRQPTTVLRPMMEGRLAKDEARMASAWRQIRDAQKAYALHMLSVRTFSEAEVLNPDGLYMGVTEDQRARLEAVIRDAMENEAVATAAELGAAIDLEKWLDSVAAYIIKRTTLMIHNVSATDQSRLRDLLAQAIRDEKDISEIRSIVVDFFDARRDNSMTIARTEIAAPYNRAHLDTFKAAGIRRKWWMTMEDDAVRPTHQLAGEAYGQDASIGVNELFRVGAGVCMVPGETGLPEEDINCRCLAMADLQHFEQPHGHGDEKPAPWVNRVFPKWSERTFANGKA